MHSIRSMSRRQMLAHSAGLLGLGLAPLARAQAYPQRPVRIVLPYTPGAITDSVTRLVAQHLGDKLKQSVIVDNRPGANGVIGTSEVVRSAGDGYTLLATPAALVTNPRLVPGIGYEPLTDLRGISLIGRIPLMLGISATVPVRTLAAFIAWGRSQRDPIPFASSGIGSGGHLGALLFAKATGLNVNHVPYKGLAGAIPDMARGQIVFALDGVQSFTPHVQSQRVRALAITGARRSAGMPDVPTMEEAGLAQFNASSWFGILAPARTPAAVITQLSQAIDEVVRIPEVHARLETFGMEPVGGDASSFDAFLRSESEKWGDVIRQFDVKAG